MFTLKLVVLSVLLAAPALSLALERRDDIKGGRLIRAEELKGGQKFEQVHEQREELLTQQQVEQEPASPLTQIKEEIPKLEETKRYEARPQVTREEFTAAKGQERREHQQQKIEERFEQLPQQKVEYDTQQVELRENTEQRRFEESEEQHLQQQQQQIRVHQGGDIKGLVAPAGQAEPYAFSYQVEGSSRSESSDSNGVVKGQYTIQGSDGPSRVVDYVADSNGFRASVNTNEFGTESKSAANVNLRTSQPNAEDITLRLEGKTKEDLAGPTAAAAPAAAGIKGAAPLAIQRLPEPPAGIKSAPLPLPVRQLPLPLPLPIQQAPLQQAPIEEIKSIRRVSTEETQRAKGEVKRLSQQQEEQHELAAPVQQVEAAPAKSAELRTPKSIGSQQRAFESANAHRVFRGPVPTALRPAPVVLVRREPVRASAPAVYRSHNQRDRHLSSPVGYRRQQVALEPVAVPANPRVSFYNPAAAAGFEDELPAFEHQDS